MQFEKITDSIMQQYNAARIMRLLYLSMLTEQEKLRLLEALSYCIEYPNRTDELPELISADFPHDCF